MADAQDTLFALAEVAVALAGFSAIVVVLKQRNSGKWTALDADQFHGMVVHAIFAVVFCLLPMLVDVVVQDPSTTLHICCAVLGVQILWHSIGVMLFKTTGRAAKALLSLGVLAGLVQFLAFSDWGVQREFEIYVVGVIWHLLQAGLLFVLLVWIKPSDIETTD